MFAFIFGLETFRFKFTKGQLNKICYYYFYCSLLYKYSELQRTVQYMRGSSPPSPAYRVPETMSRFACCCSLMNWGMNLGWWERSASMMMIKSPLACCIPWMYAVPACYTVRWWNRLLTTNMKIHHKMVYSSLKDSVSDTDWIRISCKKKERQR